MTPVRKPGFKRRTVTPVVMLAVCALAGQAAATPVIVLGDSIGVGISMAAKVPRLAHNSVAIRGGDIIEQIRRTPSDKVAVISLGTNDAVGSISGVERGVDRIVETAHRANVRLVWVGPPCVLKKWNANATRLDRILRARLSNKVTYVSVADQDVCARDLRARDGVHFNMKGYALLWDRARSAVDTGKSAEAEKASVEPVSASVEPEAAAATPKRRKHRVTKRRRGDDWEGTRTSSLQRDLPER